jgi:hypothetical protein
MTNKSYRVFLDKLGGSDPTAFIGNEGELFYDPTTGFLRLSDGSTPGGILLNMIGRQGYCGAFYDTTTQTNAAGPTGINKITLNTSYISDGITVTNGSRINLLHAGRYNIQFSLQVEKTDSGEDEFELFLLRNGEIGPYTNTKLTLTGNNAKAVAAWNYVVEEPAGVYIELGWFSVDPNVRILYEGAKTNPSRPAIPSAIVTVTQV